MLDQYKELSAVPYGESGIRCLYGVRPTVKEPAFLPHWHDRMELILVERGSIEFYLDEVPSVLGAGELGIIPPQVLHGGICREPETLYHTLMFEVERFENGTGASEKWLRSLAQGKLSFPDVTGHPEAVERAHCLAECLHDPEGSALEAVGLLYILLGTLCRLSTPCSRTAPARTESLRSVLDYIDVHFSEPLTVRDIARAFSYNETYFCRRFKKATGLTVMEYIRILRLEQAEKLLKTENCEIRDIAWRCGFPDESYFSRAFKAHYGRTPREFRKNNEKSKFYI